MIYSDISNDLESYVMICKAFLYFFLDHHGHLPPSNRPPMVAWEVLALSVELTLRESTDGWCCDDVMLRN